MLHKCTVNGSSWERIKLQFLQKLQVWTEMEPWSLGMGFMTPRTKCSVQGMGTSLGKPPPLLLGAGTCTGEGRVDGAEPYKSLRSRLLVGRMLGLLRTKLRGRRNTITGPMAIKTATTTSPHPPPPRCNWAAPGHRTWATRHPLGKRIG